MTFLYDYLIIHVILSAALLAMTFTYAWYHELSWKNEIKTILLIFFVAIVFPFFPIVAGFWRLSRDIQKSFRKAKGEK